MPTKPDALAELKAQLEQGGLEPFLRTLRTVAAVLAEDGAPLGWNAAFEPLRVAFLGCVSEAGLQQALTEARRGPDPRRVRLQLDGRQYDITLISQPNDRLLLVGEPAAPGSQPPELDALRTQLEDTRQALEVKEKELQAVLAQADEVSHTDALTFLPNRKAMQADLQRQVTYAERYGTPLSISMIDVDNFKQINDTYGHAAGDQVLRFIASEMRDRIRQPDLIGRYGGDEFLVILPNTIANAAGEQAGRLCKQVASTPVIAGKDVISVHLSIGITQYQPNSDDWQSLLERADQAMYQAKRNGRGQWAIIKA